MDAGSLIRQAREVAGMTQGQLAAAAGTSQSTLAAYESSAKSPSVRTLDRIIRSAGQTLEVSLRPAPAATGAELTRIRQRAQRIQEAARKRRIRNVRVFGSVARGEETPESDLDLLVDFDAARYGLIPLTGFARDVERIVRRPVDATTVELLRDDIRQRALAEAVPL